MKYLIFIDHSFVIFPSTISHNSMVNDKVVISAGFCSIETYRTKFDDIRVKVGCYGKSYSLNIDSHPEDNKIIESGWTYSF